MLKFKTAIYKISCVDADERPYLKTERGDKYPEMAIVGRSNVGKSSLINYLTGVKGLARTSATPGKTQALNYYLVDNSLSLVDLPGYGFAEAPFEMKKNWAELIDSYLEGSTQLKLVLLLLDMRRLPSKEDKQFFAWAQYHKKPFLIVFTKTDKVPPKDIRTNTENVLQELDAFGVPYVHTTASKRIGRAELITKINDLLAP
ncbi:MAG: ribosome biogenesis GTP-binding protein YihA/YsxC [Chlamydiota bacterium]